LETCISDWQIPYEGISKKHEKMNFSTIVLRLIMVYKAFHLRPFLFLFMFLLVGCKFDGNDKGSKNNKNVEDASNTLEQTTDNFSSKIKDDTIAVQPTSVEFEYLGPTSQGLTVAAQEGMYGFIDEKQETVIAFEFDDAQPFTQGFAAVKKDKKWGYINTSGDFVIAPTYDIATPFSNDLAAVRKGFLWGYIDKKNRIIIPFDFDFAYPFEGNTAQVMKGTSWIYINKAGQAI